MHTDENTASPAASTFDKQPLLIEGHNIGVRAGKRWLIRNLDISIAKGEIVTLVGPNGGGKSTSIRALLSLVPINEGSVTRKPGLNIAYVPQKLAIDTTMPIDVRRFMSLTHTLSVSERDKALERTGVAALLDTPVQSLSGGEFQRVQLARAIAKKPDLLVLDEPVQGVDFHGELALYELIGEIRDELQCGILLVSHDLHIVMARTDRVICLNGHICCQGTPSDVSKDEAYKNLFGSEAADLIGVYHHHHNHSHDIHDHHIPNSGPNSGPTVHTKETGSK